MQFQKLLVVRLRHTRADNGWLSACETNGKAFLVIRKIHLLRLLQQFSLMRMGI